MDKAPDAFRTISEVAEVLETPAHVLRFWESRFPQIKPVKRAGGRRYYRPADVALLAGIRQLLHSEGMTIRGVQKVLREHGVRHVAGLAGDLSVDLDLADLESANGDSTFGGDVLEGTSHPTVAQVVPFSSLPRMADREPVNRSAVEALFPVAPRPGHQAETQIEPPTELPPKPAPEPQPGSATRAATPAVVPPFASPGFPAAPNVPREGDGGFIVFSNTRSASGKQHPAGSDTSGSDKGPAQPFLPFDAPDDPHVWAEAAATPKASDGAVPGRDLTGSDLATPAQDAVQAAVLAALAAKTGLEGEDEFKPGPEGVAGDGTMPEDSAENRDATDQTASEDFVLEDWLPEDSAPDDSAPDGSGHDDSAPDASAPDASAPDDPAPDDPAHADSAPDDFAQDGFWPGTDMPQQGTVPSQPAPYGTAPADRPSGDAFQRYPDPDPPAQALGVDPATPVIAGLAARLRALSDPPTPAAALALAELHSRLGLLHAQMAEAQRLRR